jgi:mitochondrial fission protein ELM1
MTAQSTLRQMPQNGVPVLVVSVDKAGHVNQCLAVCGIMGWDVQRIVRITRSDGRDSWLQRHKGNFLKRLCLVWHQFTRVRAAQIIIVASGSSPSPLVRHYRMIYGDRLFAIFIGNPRPNDSVFDIAIRPNHSIEHRTDALPPPTRGVRSALFISGVPVRKLSRIDSLGADTVVALVGGKNRAFDIDATLFARQLSDHLTKTSAAKVAVIFSRRTPPAVEQVLRAQLKTRNITFIDRNDRAGFLQACGDAREFIVTPDSTSMICEACMTGKPVRLFDLPCFDSNTNTARFVEEVRRLNVVSLLGECHASPLRVLNESEKIRQYIQQEIGPWLSQKTELESLLEEDLTLG